MSPFQPGSRKTGSRAGRAGKGERRERRDGREARKRRAIFVCNRRLPTCGIRDRVGPVGGLLMLDALLQDIRYSTRSLRRAPAFSAVVVLTLAVAIGLTTTLFSVLYALVLRSMPVRDPQRLVAISTIDE